MLLRLRSFATRDSRILRVLMTFVCALHVYMYILGVRATEPTHGMVCDERRCMVTSMSIIGNATRICKHVMFRGERGGTR